MSTPETNEKESVHVITSVQRRRRYAASQKQAIVQRTYADGWSVSSVAREYGIAPSQLYHWRKAMEDGALTGVASDDGVVAKSEMKKLQERTRRLERLLGMKTEEVEVLKEAVRLAREKKLGGVPKYIWTRLCLP